MGQDWNVVAFTRREMLHMTGKLGACLFDGQASKLVLALAVPVLPQGFGLTQRIDATSPAVM